MREAERVTVTLPRELLRSIDRLERNRSNFIAEAVRRELERRRRADLLTSLHCPHAESGEFAETGLVEWASGLPPEDAASLVDLAAGKAVSWTPGEGWRESAE